MTNVPQPSPSRMTPFRAHPIVVGLTPTHAELVVLTAADWAESLGATAYFAYADPSLVTLRENPDGTVVHTEINPDLPDDAWRAREAQFRELLATVLAGRPVTWEFRYLAGRPDRALTHLARAVDAAAIAVGARPGRSGELHDLLTGSVASHLSHHQHRPVLVVPLEVVDWKTPLG